MITVKSLLEVLDKNTYIEAYTTDSANVYFRISNFKNDMEKDFEEGIKKYGNLKVTNISCIEDNYIVIVVEE